MRCITVTCTHCYKMREVMSEQDTIDDFLCSPCHIQIQSKDKVIKILDGAPRGYVKGTTNPVKQ